MKRLFYIHDIQDLWLFGPVLKEGNTLIYNKASNKCTAPHKFLDQLANFDLHGYDGNLEWLDSFIDDFDQFLTKECLPFTAAYLNSHPATRERNKRKIISLAWGAESTHPDLRYYHSVKNNYRLHFCPSQTRPIYEKAGFDNLSCVEPKYCSLNNLDRIQACSILGLDPSEKYITLILSSGGENLSYNNLYSDKNKTLVQGVIDYFKQSNFKVILKNKLKHHQNHEGFKGDIGLQGDTINYHQSLLLMNISEITLGFASSAVFEAEAMGARYINFAATNLLHPNAADHWHTYNNSERLSAKECLQAGLPSGSNKKRLRQCSTLSRCPSTFIIFPKDNPTTIKANFIDFVQHSQAVNFNKKYPLHSQLL